MVLGLRSSEREKERRREVENAHLDSHRTPNRTGEVLQKKQTDPSPPTHKLLQHKYWRLRQINVCAHGVDQ